MRPAKLWLVLSAVLFAAWMGYLAYLVVGLWQQPREKIHEDGKVKEVPVVLSRPQLLIADLVVTAAVESRDQMPVRAKVQEVHWPAAAQKLKDQEIAIDNLAESKGLAGAGEYILPLVNDKHRFRVASVPPSPGYPPAAGRESGPAQVYVSRDSTQAQLKQIQATLPDR